MTTYNINLIDSDSLPTWSVLCCSMRDPRQEGEQCRWTVTTSSPVELEAALEADEDVIWYEEIAPTSAQLLARATWRWTSAPTHLDDMALGGDLVAADGEILARCLWSRGELDCESDGCGVMDSRVTSSDMEAFWRAPTAFEVHAALA